MLPSFFKDTKRAIFIVFFCLVCCVSHAQLKVINTLQQYNETVHLDKANAMCNIKNELLKTVFELKYATKNNFTGKKLYPTIKTTYLRKEVADSFIKVSLAFLKLGYAVKIFDGYRPYSATKKMWDLIHDERYVANPSNGSGHNRGTTLDITLVNLETKQELNMGTGFDNFTDSAAHSFTPYLAEDVRKNRMLLRSTMEAHGFKAFESEWWHYSFAGTKKYDVLDLSFAELKKVAVKLNIPDAKY
jgi:zinc D-Ala-D-Ala dipeptidase